MQRVERFSACSHCLPCAIFFAFPVSSRWIYSLFPGSPVLQFSIISISPGSQLRTQIIEEADWQIFATNRTSLAIGFLHEHITRTVQSSFENYRVILLKTTCNHLNLIPTGWTEGILPTCSLSWGAYSSMPVISNVGMISRSLGSSRSKAARGALQFILASQSTRYPWKFL